MALAGILSDAAPSSFEQHEFAIPKFQSQLARLLFARSGVALSLLDALRKCGKQDST
jgi:hypothetical protein